MNPSAKGAVTALLVVPAIAGIPDGASARTGKRR